MKADEILNEAAKTFKERNAIYGDNYKTVGPAMMALFPNGLPLKTPDDFTRFHILQLIIVKLSRYAMQWERGHQDSLRDAAVYCAMLEMIDEELLKK